LLRKFAFHSRTSPTKVQATKTATTTAAATAAASAATPAGHLPLPSSIAFRRGNARPTSLVAAGKARKGGGMHITKQARLPAPPATVRKWSSFCTAVCESTPSVSFMPTRYR
jgi:hypothetical protein